jgi:hypothetical protein
MDDNPRSNGTTPDLPTIARRWVAPVAASAALALGLAAAVDFVNGPATPSRTAKKTASRPPADVSVPTLMSTDLPLPRHLVGVPATGAAVEVQDVRTRTPAGSLRAPANRRLQQVAAAGGGSYVVSAAAGNATVFYRLRLAGDGRPAALTALPRVRVPGASTTWSDMAVSQDGGTIAYASYRTASRKLAIDTVSMATGTRRTWTTSLPGRIGALSWAGRNLSFVWLPTRGGTVVRRQVRVLDTTRPGGDLTVSRPVFTLPAGADTAVMSRDGTTIVTGLADRSGVGLAAYETAGGRQTAVLWRWPGDSPRVTRLIPDSTGADLIVGTQDGRLVVGPAHGATATTVSALSDLAW